MDILVVEDNAETLDLLRRSLEEAGDSVTTVADVASALRAAGLSRFDVAIVDVMLPDGSGIELCRELRRQGANMPVLFLTARGEVEDRIAGLDAGGDDYLRKPFAIAELRARVRALCRRQRATFPERLRCPDAILDFAARRLTRDGIEIMLSAREWAILDALARHLGALVPRAEVIEAAWPLAGPGTSESFDVIISRLRRKLGNGDSPKLRTVRGQGLVLEAPQ